MDFLSQLLKTFLAESAIKALARKTGLKTRDLRKFVPLAVPFLIQMLTKNASSKEGASSLLEALTQHTGDRAVDEQIADADIVDGAKIIGHILGKDSQSSLLSLSSQSGLSQQQVSSVLSGIAPALLSGLSAATSSVGSGSSAGKVDLSDGLDLSDVVAMLGGAKPEPVSLLGSLFGKKKPVKEEKDAGLNGATLLQLLLANQ